VSFFFKRLQGALAQSGKLFGELSAPQGSIMSCLLGHSNASRRLSTPVLRSGKGGFGRSGVAKLVM
jgi:hypothetical protein